MNGDRADVDDRLNETVVQNIANVEISDETVVAAQPFDADALAGPASRDSRLPQSKDASSFSQIAEVCLYYENNWTPERTFSIRDALKYLPPELRQEAFKELVCIDVSLGATNHSSFDPSKYKAEFPAWVKEVDEAYKAAMTDSVVRRQSRVGRKLGNLRIDKIIGKGGMGVVYKAYNEALRRYEAVKYIAPIRVGNKERLDLIRVELETNGQVKDPRFARAYDSGNDGAFHYLVMEYVEGVDLVRYLRNDGAERKTSGPISMQEAARIVLEIAKGLGSIHRKGIIHRDIKPENVMIDAKGRVRILDLGLAKWSAATQASIARDADDVERDAVVGTPAYISPEGYARPELVDAQSDLYSLGGVFFFLVTGKTPIKRFNPQIDKLSRPLEEFITIATKSPSGVDGAKKSGTLKRSISASAPSETSPNESAPKSVDERLLSVIEKLLEPDRDKRYRTAQNVVDDIERILIDARKERRAVKMRQRKKRAVFSVVALVALVLLGVGVDVLFEKSRAPTPPADVVVTPALPAPPAAPPKKAPDPPIRISSNKSIFRVEPYENGLMIDGLRVKNSDFKENELVIPGYIDDKPVLQVRSASFPNLSIRKLVISEGVRVIGEEAFSDNSRLEELVLPESLVEIRRGAFWKCASLKKIELPSKLQIVADRAFNEAASSGALVLPDSLQYVGTGAFANLAGVVAFEASANLKNYRVVDGVLFTADGKTLKAYPTDKPDATYVVPNGTREIAANAFAGSKRLESIEIGADCESIGGGAFSRCEKLRNLILSGSANYRVVDGALYSADQKTLLAYPSGRDEDVAVVPERVERIGFAAFAGAKMRSVKLPSTLRVADNEAFKDCYQLEEIHFPEGTTTIGMRVFNDCHALKEVSLPSSLRSLGLSAFAVCKSLESIAIPDGTIKRIESYTFIGCVSLKNVEIGEGVEEIGNYAFSGCVSLNELELPKSLIYLSSTAFDAWGEAREAIVDAWIRGTRKEASETPIRISSNENIFRVEPYKSGLSIVGLKDISGLKSDELIVPGYIDGQRVLRVEANSFAFQPIRRVVVSEAVREIGDYAFDHCARLEELVLPESLFEIQNHAFSNCNSLKKIKLPSNLRHIGSNAFFATSSSGSLDIPNSLQLIGGGAFTNVFGVSGGIAEFVTDEDQKHFRAEDGVLLTRDGTTLLYYPSDKRRTSYIVPPTVKTINSGAFGGAKYLETITLNDQCKVIGGAFAYCLRLRNFIVGQNPNCRVVDGLLYDGEGKELIAYPTGRDEESVVVPDGVESVLFKSFGHAKITSLVFPSTLRVIENSAVAYCEKLTKVSIPEGVATIEQRAFSGCVALKEISAPGSLKTLGSSAFLNNVSLESAIFSDNSLKAIESRSFFGCRSLKRVKLGEGVERIDDEAFAGCDALEPIELPESLTMINDKTFGEGFVPEIVEENGKRFLKARKALELAE